MNRNFNCEDDIQEVTANTCVLVSSWSCTNAASTCRYIVIPMLFRLGQLKAQFTLLLSNLQLEKRFQGYKKNSSFECCFVLYMYLCTIRFTDHRSIGLVSQSGIE